MEQMYHQCVMDFYAQAQQLSVADFPGAALRTLQRVLPFQSAGLSRVQSEHRGTLRIASLHGLDVPPDKIDLRHEFIGAELLGHDGQLNSADLLLRAAWHRPGHAVVASRSDLPDAALREYARRTGAFNTLVLTRPHVGGMSVVSLWRARAADIYDSSQARLAEVLIAHLHQAVDINRMLRSSELFAGRSPMSGIIIAERGGAVRHLDSSALMLMRREFPRWTGSELPHEVHRKLRESVHGVHLGRHVALHLRTQDTLHFVGIREHGGASTLTTAELRVMEYTLRGGSYKDVASAMGISPSTVRNHLHAIYAKLGLRGRSDLLRHTAGLP
jgi:DNA-binding CsgD family transcriptional regulator